VTPEQFEDAVGAPLEEFAQQCHAASIALVKSGVHGISRVARGTCPGVAGQHSWVVLGMDCYDTTAVVIDPTLWSYTGRPPEIWSGRADIKPHLPHQAGNIWEWGRPDYPTGDIIELPGPFAPDAERFLEILGPLDMKGWRQLAHAPVGGWPAGKILAAMHEVPEIAQWIPIDVIGMTTDINPGGLYLPKGEG
jgi:hypothetical protein